MASKIKRRVSIAKSKTKEDTDMVNFTLKDLPALRRKRTIALNRLSKTLELGIKASENVAGMSPFLSHFSELKNFRTSFEDNHTLILALEENEDDSDELQTQCDEIYFHILALHRDLIPSDYKINTSDVSTGSKQISEIPLPVIKLPTFSGDLKSWPAFFDTYNRLIHNRANLTDSDRIHFLFSCLTGEALTLVSSFPAMGIYYTEVYDTLVKRYRNNRELAFSCWKEILHTNLKINSPHEFRRAFDLFNENLKILQTLNLPVDQWDFVLCYLLLSKLDTKTRCEFEQMHSSSELPSYALLKQFVYSRCEALVRDSHFKDKDTKVAAPSTVTKPPFKYNKSQYPFHSAQPVLSSTKSSGVTSLLSDSNTGKSEIKCLYCQGTHSTNNCEEFVSKPVAERYEWVKQKQFCFNCLRGSHQLRECRSMFRCQKCKQKHHTLLHMDHEDSAKEQGLPCMRDEDQKSTSMDNNEASSSAMSTFTHTSVVMLSTATVYVLNANGNYQPLRALIDSGSQAHFLSEDAVRKLGLKPAATNKSISGLGKTMSKISGSVSCSIGKNDQAYFNIEALILPVICGVMPSMHIDTTSWNHIQNLHLADPQCNVPGPIEMLLGAEVFTNLLLPGRLDGETNQPTAINSIFGWLLIGKTNVQNKKINNNLAVLLSTNDISLNQEVTRLWELEEIPKSKSLTLEEEICEQKYINGITRDDSGRYTVALPFKLEDYPQFPGARDVAIRRFHLLERRLLKYPELYQEYREFLKDYLNNKHMSLVALGDVGKGKYYIPHHCVSRPDSETTKTRVVFDASSACASGQSLNDTLLTGEKLQGNLLTVLLRFRLHAVVFIGDVKQMFRQINIRVEDRDYQRILWRFNPETPIQEYCLNTVTYGTSAAPFLACRTIKQLINDEGDKFPLASQVLQTDIYVDDVTTGSSSLEQARLVKAEVVELLKRGGFTLRKWASNHPELLSDIRPEDCLSGSACFDNNCVKSIKVLGLRWSSDNFVFAVQPNERECTKRNILSELARIFDPLGFLSPITFLAKRLVQILWIQGLGWDDQPSENVIRQWHDYTSQLPLLQAVQIPRRITVENVISYQLHGFADSSEAGYGAVIYLRAVDSVGRVTVKLICSKARVAPIKIQSLPRLELCAAVLLSDLLQYVQATYVREINISQIFAWSDSTVVLAWLQSPASRWKTFVANRVSHIQDILPSSSWCHVSTNDNPADICSRGALPKALLEHSLWWAGPTWLSEGSELWPLQKALSSQADLVQSEERTSVFMVEQPENIVNCLLEKFSSIAKITRILAYCLRFIHNIRNKNSKNVGVFTNTDRKEALMLVVKQVQVEHFSREFDCLKTGKPLPKPFRKLNPFVDREGILRVGGRLARSGLAFEHKHPALLPRKSRFTYLIINEIHREHCHPGLNTTHYLILQQFWILSPKRAIRTYLSDCVRCFRIKPKALEPYMSDLPVARVNAVKPFSIVGVDFGGPFNIKHGKHRGAKIGKAYLCLFICFTTKAVHLEVVSDLTSEAFIASLRRFIARRGRCNIIHSDQGTNFVGAKNELYEYMQSAAVHNRIEFRFNPPSAPHFGGVWEIQIKAAKSLLYRAVGAQSFTFEELTTLFAQIEATMNSRPLCPLSSDPNDLNVLTPGHFLTMEPLTAVPEDDFLNTNVHRLNRWQLIQHLHQGFWRRWKSEYLNSLTQRAKWTKNSQPLKVNSIVILKCDNTYPLHWPLARVMELHPSPDGVVRQATVKTTTGILKRPLVKLCPLPDGCDSE